MTIEQTIAIPADRRLVIEVPETFTSGTISVVLLDASKTVPPEMLDAEIIRRQREAAAADTELQEIVKQAGERKVPVRFPDPKTVAEAVKQAKAKAADPNRLPISRFFGRCPGLFGDIDPIAYQRSIRDEWDE
jgi:hypothetical protein